MRTPARFRTTLVAVMIGALLTPHASLLAQSPPHPRIGDVRLDKNGSLRGQLVNQNGVGLAGHEIVLLGRGKMVARAQTNKQGEFVLAQLRGGVYVASDGETSQGLRIWTAQAAPKHARKAILFVKDGKATRAQWTSGMQRGFLSDYAAGEFLAVGLLTAGIIALAADASDSSP